MQPRSTLIQLERRVRVVRVAHSVPRVLDHLRSGAIHLTGLFVLAPHLNEETADALLAEARGKSRREIEYLLARWFPKRTCRRRSYRSAKQGKESLIRPQVRPARASSLSV